MCLCTHKSERFGRIRVCLYFKSSWVGLKGAFIQGSGEETERRYFCFSYSKDQATESHDHWRRMLWSLRVLEEGTWPSHGYNGEPVDVACKEGGTPLAEGRDGLPWTGTVLFCKGDLEFMANEIGFHKIESTAGGLGDLHL